MQLREKEQYNNNDKIWWAKTKANYIENKCYGEFSQNHPVYGDFFLSFGFVRFSLHNFLCFVFVHSPSPNNFVGSTTNKIPIELETI